MKLYQQGDVLLKQVDKLPTDVKEVELVDRILQRGETTGHKHQFLGNTVLKVYADEVPVQRDLENVMRITDIVGRRFIEVLETADLLHEEHKPIRVEPGLYELDIVREWDYTDGITRSVVD